MACRSAPASHLPATVRQMLFRLPLAHLASKGFRACPPLVGPPTLRSSCCSNRVSSNDRNSFMNSWPSCCTAWSAARVAWHRARTGGEQRARRLDTARRRTAFGAVEPLAVSIAGDVRSTSRRPCCRMIAHGPPSTLAACRSCRVRQRGRPMLTQLQRLGQGLRIHWVGAAVLHAQEQLPAPGRAGRAACWAGSTPSPDSWLGPPYPVVPCVWLAVALMVRQGQSCLLVPAGSDQALRGARWGQAVAAELSAIGGLSAAAANQ